MFFLLSCCLVVLWFSCLSILSTIQPDTKLCLEGNTERSESNPGRSLGIYSQEENGCLEDSTSPLKKTSIDKNKISMDKDIFFIFIH